MISFNRKIYTALGKQLEMTRKNIVRHNTNRCVC